MNFFENILLLLDSNMERPENYGWFHWLMIVIVLIATIFLCWKFKNCKDSTFRRISCVIWLTMVVLELYKQIIFSFDYNDGTVTWDYSWYSFPYQLCATPMYTLPFIVFLKDGKIRNAFIAYTMTFAFFGGLAVYIYPNDVFVRTIGINIQAMVHHGLQVFLGVFFAIHRRKELSFKFYLGSIPVFLALLTIAFLLNELVYQLLQVAGMDDTFNMFFISPNFPCTLPVLSIIYEHLPYPLFLCCYAFGFILISFAIYCLQKTCLTLAKRSSLLKKS